MEAKVLNMKGEDISPKPLTEKEQFQEDLAIWIATMPAEEFFDKLFNKYIITIKQQSNEVTKQ